MDLLVTSPVLNNAILQERKLGFIEAMKLEIERLRLNLSAAERDRALISVGIDTATINPNVLLDESYTGRLCRVANTLALLGQASVEDKITAAIGLESTDGSDIDFWNIPGIGDSCSGGMCQVHAETRAAGYASSTLLPSAASQSIFLCSQCGRKVCKICASGRGSLLLASYNSREASNYNGVLSQGGSSHGSPADLPSNRSMTLDEVICKQCCNETVLDALTLDYVRVLVSQRRSARADNAVQKALGHVIGFPSKRNRSSGRKESVEVSRQLLNGDESLAEFPFASFLHSVCSFLVFLQYIGECLDVVSLNFQIIFSEKVGRSNSSQIYRVFHSLQLSSSAHVGFITI